MAIGEDLSAAPQSCGPQSCGRQSCSPHLGQALCATLEIYNHFAGIGARKEANKRLTRVLDTVVHGFF